MVFFVLLGNLFYCLIAEFIKNFYICRKSEEELETHFDKWLFLLKNLSKLEDPPTMVQGEIFDKVFELTEIKRLKVEDMETYRKSVLEYYDVQDAMECARIEAREEALKEGIEKGTEEGIEKGKISVIKMCLQKNMPIEDIVDITGFSKEQIYRYSENGALKSDDAAHTDVGGD